MKLRLVSLFIVLLFCISLVGCIQVDKINVKQIGKELKNVLQTPDKIIIFSNVGSKELDKNSSEFKKIIELTQKRFHDKVSTTQDIIDDSTMSGIRKDGSGIEFLYNNETVLSLLSTISYTFN